MKILKIFESIENNLDNCFLVAIPDDYKKDYHFLSLKAIQKITNNNHICGTQIYDEKFDGKIPENKKIYEFSEIANWKNNGFSKVFFPKIKALFHIDN